MGGECLCDGGRRCVDAYDAPAMVCVVIFPMGCYRGRRRRCRWARVIFPTAEKSRSRASVPQRRCREATVEIEMKSVGPQVTLRLAARTARRKLNGGCRLARLESSTRAGYLQCAIPAMLLLRCICHSSIT